MQARQAVGKPTAAGPAEDALSPSGNRGGVPEVRNRPEPLRTCEKITKCRVAAGFLAWPRREGGGNTRSGVADALHRPAGCLRQAVSLRSAVPPEQRRSSQKDTQPYGREQERPSGRVARSVTARCGDAPSRAPCHTAFLALVRRFLIFFTGSKNRLQRFDAACLRMHDIA